MSNDWCHSERCMRSLKHPIKLVDVGTSLPRRHLHKCWQICNVQSQQNVGWNAHPRQRHSYFELRLKSNLQDGSIMRHNFPCHCDCSKSCRLSSIHWISLANTLQRQWPHILQTLSHYNLELAFVWGNLRFDRTGFLSGLTEPKNCR
jgi:hypothetical protein